MKIINLIKKQATILAAVLIGSVVGGATTAVVLAAIPNSQTGQINACYRNQGGPFNPPGNLRVIDAQAGQSCNNNETALNWRQDGGQIISNRITVPLESANSQQIINISGFGHFLVTNCSDQNQPSFKFVNTTTHNLEAASINIIEPQQEIMFESNITELQLGYREASVNHITNVIVSYAIDQTLSSCVFFAQATVSQN